MELFYSNLANEMEVRKAFENAQAQMRKKYDPYFWAAFVLVN